MPSVSSICHASRWMALLLIACLVLLPSFTAAQTYTSSLAGNVRDASGAAVPGAKVTVKNEGTNVVEERKTNEAGFFSYPTLLPGTYTLTVSAKGFATWETHGLVLNLKDSRTMNIDMAVATTTEQVTVVSSAELIAPVDSGESGMTLNQGMVNNIAIQGRDAAELIKFMPGMGMNNGLGQTMWNSLTTASNTGPVGQFSANGTQPYGGLQLTMDGGLLVDTGNMGTQVANINQDQTAEMTVHNSSFAAEYARGPVVVEASGKSGGSQFHGGAYMYARNGVMNAEDASLKANNVAKPNDSQYYPGGNIGGPVILPGLNYNKNHDKLFFFAGYEYMKQQPEGNLVHLFVPTADMLGQNPNKPYADFTPAYLQSLGLQKADGSSNAGSAGTTACAASNNTQWWFNNYCGATTGVTGAPIVATNGQIPLSQLDPNMLALASVFPKPNLTPTSGNPFNYQFVNSTPVNRWEAKIRGDWNITPKNRLYVSYNRQNETDINNFGVWWWPSDTLPYPTTMPAKQVSNLWSASFVHEFTTSLTNETVFNYTSFINPVHPSDIGAVAPNKVGYNVANPFGYPGITPMIPNMVSWGNQTGNGGWFPGLWAPAYAAGFSGGAFGALKRVPSIADNLSWVKGTHTMKFGFFWAHGGNQQTEGAWAGSANAFPQGRYDYDNWAWGTTGNPLADFVLGHPADFAQTSADPLHTLWYNEIAFYAQDTWKASRRLTLNYGLRLDHEGQWYPAGNTPGMVVWDPSTCPASTGPGPACVGPNLPGLSWNAINKSVPISGFTSRYIPDPRVGAAYDLFGTGKTVIRGGYGIYRYQLAYNDVNAALDAPLGIQNFATSGNCHILKTSQVASDPTCQPTSAAGTLPASSTGLGIQALQKGDNRTPWVQNWTFLIDQRAPWNSLFEIGYVGSHTSDMLIAANLSNIDLVPVGGYFQPNPVTGVTYYCQGAASPTCNHSGPPNTSQYLPWNYSSIQVASHGSYSNYNAMQMMWQKQTGRSTFMVNYTFSKVLGIRDGQTDNGNGNGTVIDWFNMKNNYGVLAYDHTNIFNAAYVLSIPGVHTSNKFASGAINGWQLSGTLQYQSGAPIQPNSGGNLNANYQNGESPASILGTNGNALVPILTCDPRQKTMAGQYFNPGCFAMPTRGQNGNIIWPYIKGPAYFNTDLSLFKNFHVTERQTLQFRIQAFNFINHDLPDLTQGNALNLNFNANGINTNTCGSTTSGSCTDGRAHYTTGRRVLELALKYNF